MKKRIDQLEPGDRVDLEGDIYADPNGERVEFIFEYETVETVERETADCVLVEFESGFACGFPPDHLVEIAPEE